MKALIISGNQPRHLEFVDMLWRYFDDRIVILEDKIKPQNDFLIKKEKLYFPISDFDFLSDCLMCKSGEINNDKMVSEIKKIQPDIMFIFGCSLLMPSVFSIAPRGCINIHTGIVQVFRGVDSCFWGVYDEKPWGIGATVHYVDETIDAGLIIAQSRPEINEEDDFSDLFLKSCKCGFNTLKYNLFHICNGNICPSSLKNKGILYNNKDLSDEKIVQGNAKIKNVLKNYLSDKRKMNNKVKLIDSVKKFI